MTVLWKSQHGPCMNFCGNSCQRTRLAVNVGTAIHKCSWKEATREHGPVMSHLPWATAPLNNKNVAKWKPVLWSELLNWSACSPELSPTENIRSVMRNGTVELLRCQWRRLQVSSVLRRIWTVVKRRRGQCTVVNISMSQFFWDETFFFLKMANFLGFSIMTCFLPSVADKMWVSGICKLLHCIFISFYSGPNQYLLI